MIALGLAATFFELSMGSDMSQGTRDDLMERLKSLRGYGQLPRGRERRNQKLTDAEIAAAVLGLVSPNPQWAGHTAKILCGLRTVGGATASFQGADTLQQAIERLVSDETARKALITLTVSGAESGTNSHGSATLIHEIEGNRHYVFYVPAHAVSQFQPRMEERFDAHLRHAALSRDLSFSRRFFEGLARAIKASGRQTEPPVSDGSEYETEEAHAARHERLGARPNSRFLNTGVDNQVTWPQREMLVTFDRYTLVLMPKTREHSPSIHVDLVANGLTDRDGMTVINRFLSIMTWCDDQFAIAQPGWSGNPVPVAVRKRDLAFTTAPEWIFNRDIPTDEKARRALAIYREARNAQQNFMVSYAVLNFFKVVELGHESRGDVKNWFRDNFRDLCEGNAYREQGANFMKICNGEKPHEYIWKACRVAVSHANKDSKSDPDDANELVRLHTAADILRLFARHFITSQFGISDVMHSGG
jgi:hypothetical protein